MHSKPLAAAIAAAAFCASAGSAAATPVTYVFKGTVGAGGIDVVGAFGAANADLSGKAFTASFTRDDDTPGAVITTGFPVHQIEGWGLGAPVHAILEIEGVTYAFGDNFGRQASATYADDCGLGCDFQNFELASSNFSYTFDGSVEDLRFDSMGAGARASGANFLPSNDYHDLPSLAAADLEDPYGWVDIFRRGGDGVTFPYERLTHLTLNWDTLEAPVVASPTPEPATWAVMILGFGAIGALGRRRRAIAA